MRGRRFALCALAGCALALVAHILTFSGNQIAAWLLLPGAYVAVLVHNAFGLAPGLSRALLVVLNGLLWGSILLLIWKSIDQAVEKANAV